MLLYGAVPTPYEDPMYLVISNVTSSMFVSREKLKDGESPCPEKRLYMNQLTDSDIFTYVSLQDVEIPIRKGALMTGDFNAISSVDNYHYQKDLSDPVFLVHDYVRNNTPYIDVIERMYPGEFQSSTLVGRRIDMVYVTPALFERVLKASTIYDGFAKASRDPRGKEVNYPVLVSIRL